ncbi:MAG: 6,7-dimethyl-8-ribityllumazine synthase [Chlorobi bacterium]|nr:6,7-dimethyl-8-ribityllumazine synthase [Chlorobiota bacterium]
MAKQHIVQFPRLNNVIKLSDQITGYIVHSSWHLSIIEKMVSGSLDALRMYSITQVEVVPVSGTFEIPQMISHIINTHKDTNKHIVIIALGIVIQGETYHDRVISYSVANALQSLAITHPSVPIGFGILTVYDRQQAVERAFGKGNKGIEATIAVLTQLDRIISISTR